jgi:NADH-quinone oxidoreductase subunit K
MFKKTNLKLMMKYNVVVLHYFSGICFFKRQIFFLEGIFFSFSFYDLYMIGFILFFMGLIGLFVVKRNLLILLFSLELIFFSMNFFFLSTSIYLNDLIGYIFFLSILVIAAADSAIGLGILIAFYRFKSTILVENLSNLKG